MNAKRPDFIVGLTVIVTTVVTVLAVLWLGQTDIRQSRQEVTARFREVGNARVGNAAVIRGVRAGRIDRIELDADGTVLVRMSLDREVALPREPVVLLSESSLFGEWQATIAEQSALPDDAHVLEQIRYFQTRGGDTMIPGATVKNIAQVTATAGRIAGDMASVARRVEGAFDDAAASELRASIRNLSTLTRTLAATVQNQAGGLDTLSRDLTAAVRTLHRASVHAERIGIRVDTTLAADDVRRTWSDFAQAASNVKRSAATIDALTTGLAESQGRLHRILASTDTVLAKVNAGHGTLGLLVNDSSLYRGADSLVTQLRSLVSDIQANPKRYLNLRLF